MRNKTKTYATLLTLIISFPLGFLSIHSLGEYGIFLFLTVPFLIGFLPPYIVGKNEAISLKSSYKLSFINLGLAILGLLLFGLEGVICILMVSPLIVFLVWIGSYIGFLINEHKWLNTTNVIILMVLGSSLTLSFDYISEPHELIPVKTTIIVDAPIADVWQNVVSFDEIEAPVDWIFKTGIAYPTHATIDGQGVGAIRYCNFTTGTFIEPITTWDAPFLLQFDVEQQPVPMHEINPFGDVHPPHLNGYFKSHKGQFRLTAINDKKTQLEGTTWYTVDMHPQFYWKTWTEFIIHKIHRRVLEHIKIESE